MERVTGIGGYFFKSKNNTKLNEWYEKNLGIGAQNGYDNGYDNGYWWQDAGPTIFYAETEESDNYINYRVKDLDAMVEQLRAQGNEVHIDERDNPEGKFAHLSDPEGNLIELWQPYESEMIRPKTDPND